jgi:hypothetical protein
VSSLGLLVLLGVVVGIRFYPKSGSAAGVGKSQVSAVIDRRYRGGKADAPTLAAAGSALELGSRLVRGAPGAALSPLSDEMERLEKDWARTEQFLLASLP